MFTPSSGRWSETNGTRLVRQAACSPPRIWLAPDALYLASPREIHITGGGMGMSGWGGLPHEGDLSRGSFCILHSAFFLLLAARAGAMVRVYSSCPRGPDSLLATLKARAEEFVAKAIAGEATLIEQNGKRAVLFPCQGIAPDFDLDPATDRLLPQRVDNSNRGTDSGGAARSARPGQRVGPAVGIAGCKARSWNWAMIASPTGTCSRRARA